MSSAATAAALERSLAARRLLVERRRSLLLNSCRQSWPLPLVPAAISAAMLSPDLRSRNCRSCRGGGGEGGEGVGRVRVTRDICGDTRHLVHLIAAPAAAAARGDHFQHLILSVVYNCFWVYLPHSNKVTIFRFHAFSELIEIEFM